jgi:hypothetical protein
LKIDIEKKGQNSISGIGFNMKAYFDYISTKPIFDVCYQLYENDWQGSQKCRNKTQRPKIAYFNIV